MRTMRIRVNIPQRNDVSYDIFIGENVLDMVVSEAEGNRFAIITDRNVEALYGKTLLKMMNDAGMKTCVISIPPGEKSKEFESLARIHSELIQKGMDRGSAIIALGGGVVGDLAGFAASTFMRGIPYYQVPTTLLAMVDSSVGGKTGINLPEGKNLVGSFHQPRKVFIGVDTLDSLPEKEFNNGMMELIKSGLIRDETLVHLAENSISDVKKRNRKVMKKLIFRAVKVKTKIIEADEKESGIRMLLNYGHTFGHAYEMLSGFKMSHGEAVAAGMEKAAMLAHRLGRLSKEELEKHDALIRHFIRVKLPDYSADEVIAVMKTDKKARQGKIRFVLLKRIGEAYVEENIPEGVLREVLEND